jgi:dolichol-phosphate mannosyltransferase
MSKPAVSVVVPAYNEEGNVRELFRGIVAALSKTHETFEVLFVDDGSSDSTAERVAAICKADPRVGLIRLSRNFGHQAALMAGLDHARGDAVIVMDADLQHPPDLIPRLIDRWRSGVQVVQSVRQDNSATGVLKRTTSRLAYWFLRRLTNIPITEAAADFFLLDRKALNALNSCREKGRFTRGLVAWVGFQRETVTYNCGERYTGTSKYTFRKMLAFFLDGVFAFSVTPLRVTGLLGLATAVGGLLYLVYVLAVILSGKWRLPGWASLVGVFVVMNGVQLISLWALGEYVARTAENARGRPSYLVDQFLAPESGKARSDDTAEQSDGRKASSS